MSSFYVIIMLFLTRETIIKGHIIIQESIRLNFTTSITQLILNLCMYFSGMILTIKKSNRISVLIT